MTYAQFHALFVLPPLALLALASWRAARAGTPLTGGLGRPDRAAGRALAALVAIALVYTFPWDALLIARGVWGYPPGRVAAALAGVPLEEIAFFALQTLGTGAFVLLLARGPLGRRPARAAPRPWPRNLAGAALLLAAGAAGAALLASPGGTYLGLILVWACPVLALQWGFGGDLIAGRARLALAGVLLPSAYLWLADRAALAAGVWWISEELTTGLRPLGLPVEEALFFLVTNALVVAGLLLMLHPAAPARLARLRPRWWQAALVGWALVLLPAPLAPAWFPLLAYLGTGLLAVGMLGYARARYGSRAWALLGVALLFGLAVEVLGAATGVPFGRYAYTAPGPSLLGVPLLVPLGWWAFVLVAIEIAPRRSTRLAAPLALVAWDLGLDPLMVERGFWRFAREDLFGVPWTNYLGWYLAGAVLVSLLLRLEPRLGAQPGREPRLVFVAQAFLMGVGLALFGLPAAGLGAAAAMGGLAAAWWVPGRRERRAELRP